MIKSIISDVFTVQSTEISGKMLVTGINVTLLEEMLN